MSRRIQSLKESPCYKCGRLKECNQKIKRNPVFADICNSVFSNADFDYQNCGLYIAIEAGHKWRVENEN